MKQDYTMYIYRADRRCKTGERLFSTTVWPMWMSGAVGSRPSLIRSGVPLASDFCSFLIQSACGMSSSQPRKVTANACATSAETGVPAGNAAVESVGVIEVGGMMALGYTAARRMRPSPDA